MPSSPIHRFSLTDDSTPNSFECSANISGHYDSEAAESEMKKLVKYGLNQGHALLRKQMQRPIILQAQKAFGRRFTFSGHSEHKIAHKKRRRFTSVAMPTKFLLGGSRTDPLNLSSLQDEKINQQLNAFSPASSPMPMPIHRTQVQVLIPPNIYDPLNLNTGEDIAFNLLSSKPRKRRRHRKVRREEETVEEKNQTLFNKDVTSSHLPTNSQVIVVSHDKQPKSTNIEFPVEQTVASETLVSPSTSEEPPMKFVKKSVSGSISKDVEEPSVRKKVLKHKSAKGRFQHQLDTVRFRANAAKFCYGNHVTNHSNWDSGDGVLEDLRLRFLHENLFRSKDVLDIGCNTGRMLLYIAKHYKPKKVTGIDIDKRLVSKAQRKLRLFLSEQLATDNDFPQSMATMFGPLSKLVKTLSVPANEFPNNVNFFEANYVPVCEDYLETQKPEYDTILCLRVTKWIHLNFGDEGLKMAFKRMYAQLRFGGHLILEPQPWFTYSASKRITPSIYSTYCNLKMRPNSFCDYLLSSEVGFSSCQIIGRTYNCTKAYRQNIYCLTKGYTDLGEQNLSVHTLSPIPFHLDTWPPDKDETLAAVNNSDEFDSI